MGEENGRGRLVGVAPGCALLPIPNTGFVDDGTIERLFEEANAAGRGGRGGGGGGGGRHHFLQLVPRFKLFSPHHPAKKSAITRAATKGRNGKGCVIIFSAGNANRPLSGSVREDRWPQNALRGLTRWLNGFAVHPDVIALWRPSTALGTKAPTATGGRHISVAAPQQQWRSHYGASPVGVSTHRARTDAATPGLGW